jgi:hypothetical protein
MIHVKLHAGGFYCETAYHDNSVECLGTMFSTLSSDRAYFRSVFGQVYQPRLHLKTYSVLLLL